MALGIISLAVQRIVRRACAGCIIMTNMKCPVCKDTTLLMSERQGVEIDYCPECRGVWLDRGELDKLIAGEEKAYADREPARSDDRRNEREYHDEKRSDDHYDKHDKYDKRAQPKKRKRESFLGEIFEMFGD